MPAAFTPGQSPVRSKDSWSNAELAFVSHIRTKHGPRRETDRAKAPGPKHRPARPGRPCLPRAKISGRRARRERGPMPSLNNPKHERVCLEYVKELNATQAYVRAGYAFAESDNDPLADA